MTTQTIADPSLWRVGDVFEGEYMGHPFTGVVWDDHGELLAGGLTIRFSGGTTDEDITGHVTRTVAHDVAASADAVIRAVQDALGVGYDHDPVLAAKEAKRAVDKFTKGKRAMGGCVTPGPYFQSDDVGLALSRQNLVRGVSAEPVEALAEAFRFYLRDTDNEPGAFTAKVTVEQVEGLARLALAQVRAQVAREVRDYRDEEFPFPFLGDKYDSGANGALTVIAARIERGESKEGE